MVESEPAGGAAPGDAAKDGVAAEAEAPGRRRRLRLPTSIFVTLLGIGLSAWLLPAFTRQWDDRRKAHELQAAMVEEMASETAQALADAQLAAGTRRRTQRPVPFAASAKEWSAASLRIEAKLGAYFPPALSALWEEYTQYVSLTLEAAYGSTGIAIFYEGTTTTVETLVYHFNQARIHLAEFKEAAKIGGGALALLEVESALLAVQKEIQRRVLETSPGGYSTTFDDLVDDLLP